MSHWVPSDVVIGSCRDCDAGDINPEFSNVRVALRRAGSRSIRFPWVSGWGTFARNCSFLFSAQRLRSLYDARHWKSSSSPTPAGHHSLLSSSSSSSSSSCCVFSAGERERERNNSEL
ncbi:hypothetical protein BHM03_00036472 [Ensete ventricosum]|nr:hypothetical protein BHM03_00036472 [Ensete ventricosum]